MYTLILCIYSHFGCIPSLCVYYSHFVSMCRHSHFVCLLLFSVYSHCVCTLPFSEYTLIFVCILPFSVYTLYTKVALSHGDANYSSKMRLYTQEQCDSVHKNLRANSYFLSIISFCVYTPILCVYCIHKSSTESRGC